MSRKNWNVGKLCKNSSTVELQTYNSSMYVIGLNLDEFENVTFVRQNDWFEKTFELFLGEKVICASFC